MRDFRVQGAFRGLATALTLVFLAGCNSDGKPAGLQEADSTTPGAGNSVAASAAPVISGSPLLQVLIDESYVFAPTTQAAGGSALAFSVQNLPKWASFDPTSGRMWGAPAITDIGQYSNIQISASDGTTAVSLAPFDITVVEAGPGSVTLTWLAPTVKVDGSQLTGLAGYRVYYGLEADNLNKVVHITSLGITSHVIEGLPLGEWHFAIRAVDTAGLESDLSPILGIPVS